MKTLSSLFLAAAVTLVMTTAVFSQGSGDAVTRLAAGKASFEKKCKFCHSLARALGSPKERSEWSQTVKRMVTYGAPLNSVERENVTAYLAARSSFEKNCNVCHESTRVLSDPETAKDWKRTLEKMSVHMAELSKKDKDVKQFGEEDLEEIAAFLTIVIPTE